MTILTAAVALYSRASPKNVASFATSIADDLFFSPFHWAITLCSSFPHLFYRSKCLREKLPPMFHVATFWVSLPRRLLIRQPSWGRRPCSCDPLYD
uniref:Uncharacterized protein n=1 Tax=Panstrongylus lignarius TaxID=156445 RepID=A0A224XYB6_9HEMI